MSTTHFVQVLDGAGHVELPNYKRADDGEIVALTDAQYAQLSADALSALLANQGAVTVDAQTDRWYATKLLALSELADDVWEFVLPVPGAVSLFGAFNAAATPAGSGHAVTLGVKVAGNTLNTSAAEVEILTADVTGVTNAVVITPSQHSNAGYFYEGDAVRVYTVGDVEGVNEITRIVLTADGGTWTITYSGQTTAALDWDASAAEIQAALEALSNIAVGDVEVTREFVDGDGNAIDIEWIGTKGETNITAPTTTVTDLELLTVAGDGTAVVSTLTGGVVDPSFTDGYVLLILVGTVMTEAAVDAIFA